MVEDIFPHTGFIYNYYKMWRKSILGLTHWEKKNHFTHTQSYVVDCFNSCTVIIMIFSKPWPSVWQPFILVISLYWLYCLQIIRILKNQTVLFNHFLIFQLHNTNQSVWLYMTNLFSNRWTMNFLFTLLLANRKLW